MFHKKLLQIVCAKCRNRLSNASNYLYQCCLVSTLPNTSPQSCNSSNSTTMTTHTPVMTKEVLNLIDPKPNQVVLDMTFGGGGHTKAFLEYEPNCKIFALDRDPDAFQQAENLSKELPNIQPLLGKFSEVGDLLQKFAFHENSIDAALFDVGSSSLQFDKSERGFSLSRDGPLDMRMDKNRCPDQPTASDVVNTLDETDLYKIIKVYGEETKARYIARAIVDSRYSFGKITSTKQFATIVESAFNEGVYRKDKLHRNSHVATKTFQALRTFVNNELNELHNGLEIIYKLLKPGGICVAISFHSLEDRIIKRLFHGINVDDKINKTLRDHQKDQSVVFFKEDIEELLQKKWEPINKKPLVPTEEEINYNPRARSAKLRAAVKKTPNI